MATKDILQTQIHYRVLMEDPGAHLLDVITEIPQPDPAGQVLSLPAWIPGSYLVRDFARHVVTVDATGPDGPVALRKQDKSTWRCAPCDGPLTVTARIYAYDLRVRGAYFDTTRAFFNGTCVFFKVHGRESEPVRVTLTRPETCGEDWRVATTLPEAGATRYDFGEYSAPDYDALIDHPVEISCYELVEFEAGGVPHAVALTGRHRCDTERLAADLKRVCEQQQALFGGLPAMDRYLFLTLVVGAGYGGLEHRSSTSLICQRDELPRRGQTAITDGYRRFLGLCSHEYFHLWNVKRIRPAKFTPFDLSRETPTRLLWVFEGITSYYDDLALVRSGLIEPAGYLELLADTISRVTASRGRRWQSLADSSFDAWIKLYKRNANSPNATVSYYTKGALAALALDFTIRRRSGGECSLDDVMRALWERYGETGVGVGERDFETLAETVTGLELSPFFERTIRGTGDIPMDTLLQEVGVNTKFVCAGTRARANTEAEPRPSLDVNTRYAGDRVVLAQVLAGGPAERAGLASGDELVAIDGIRVDRDSWPRQLVNYASGDTVNINVFRRDEMLEFEVRLEAAPKERCRLALDEKAGADAKARRGAWLGR